MLARLVGLLAVLALAAGAAVVWRAEQLLSAIVVPPAHELPIPWPLSDDSRRQLLAAYAKAAQRAGAVRGSARQAPDLEQSARIEAVRRGERLVTVIGACASCHGPDLGGAGHAPNLTPGRSGGALAPVDWLNALRHGISPEGRALLKAARATAGWSDREISDAAAYLQSVPGVQRVVDRQQLGITDRVDLALGRLATDAARLDPNMPRPSLPPKAESNAIFGAHLASACTRCHDATPSPWTEPAPPVPALANGEAFAEAVRRHPAHPPPWRALDPVELQALRTFFRR